MYDFAHPIQDALEGITYSLCSLEFENHRPLYDWVIENCFKGRLRPKQREFARLNVTYTVMSKRYLRKLVETGIADGWDDPRLPTLCALRRRGYTPSAIFDFIKRAGIAKTDSLVDIELLEACARDELNATAQRRVCILDPIKIVIDNYPEDLVEHFPLPNNPTVENAGFRDLPFTKEIYIDRNDFAEVPPPKFFRLKPDGEVRLMGAYIIKCGDIVKDADGNIIEIHCTADLEVRNGNPTDRKVKGTIHWLSAKYCDNVSVSLYEKLFTIPNLNDMPEGTEYNDFLNPDSVIKLTGCKVERSLVDATPGERFQFVRTGYFVKDTKYPNTFNRIVTLKDSFSKK